MDRRAKFRRVGLKLFQQLGQTRHRVSFDRTSGLAERLPLWQRICHPVTFYSHEPQGLVVPVRASVIASENSGVGGVVHLYGSRVLSIVSATN